MMLINKIESPTRIAPAKRWDKPFDSETSNQDVERLLKVYPFNLIDQKRFPSSKPLASIIKNDARIIQFGNGDMIVREGDYGANSIFIVLSGTVRVVVDDTFPKLLLGQDSGPSSKTFLQALAQLWSRNKGTETRSPDLYTANQDLGTRHDRHGHRTFLQDVPGILAKYKTVPLHAGDIFGEVSAFIRGPRTATVFVEDDAELLEIRWQGLRDIRRYADNFRELIDSLYRERSLNIHLRDTPFFRHLSEWDLKKVADLTSFESFGSYDWHISYKKLSDIEAGERIADEPIIFHEGDHIDELIMIRSGFARVSIKVGNGHYTLKFLGAGDSFSFEEIALNWKDKKNKPISYSLRSIGYTDILKIPIALVEKYVLPYYEMEHRLPKPTTMNISPNVWDVAKDDSKASVDQDMLEFLIDERFINGTSTMVIDLDRCTRCDDCVRACSATHNNNPRFIRHGLTFNNYMVANACMHCSDPVCMIGCPTGAIHRDRSGGQVVINDVTCIGCSSCANSCPYNNIRMVQIQDGDGTPIISKSTFSPILKATKCDLCVDQYKGVSPACEQACPHDALKRVDMRDLDPFAEWLNR